MRVAIFPGSFDPMTRGHLDIVQRAAGQFDRLILAVLVNPSKQGRLPPQARMDMLRRATSDLPNVCIEQFSGLLVRFAESCGAQTIVRGLRDATDFAYECQMAQLNKTMNPSVETLFMMTSPQFSFISSTRVREIAALGGDISSMVPEAILAEVGAAYRR